MVMHVSDCMVTVCFLLCVTVFRKRANVISERNEIVE